MPKCVLVLCILSFNFPFPIVNCLNKHNYLRTYKNSVMCFKINLRRQRHKDTTKLENNRSHGSHTNSCLPPPHFQKSDATAKNANWEAIRQKIKSCWNSFSENSPSRFVNENWLKLKSFLNQCLDKFIPTKMTSPRGNLPWLSKSLLASIRGKNIYIAKPIVQIKLTFGQYKM